MNLFVKRDITNLLKKATGAEITVNGSPMSSLTDAICLIVNNEIARCSVGMTKKQMLEHLELKNENL